MFENGQRWCRNVHVVVLIGQGILEERQILSSLLESVGDGDCRQLRKEGQASNLYVIMSGEGLNFTCRPL